MVPELHGMVLLVRITIKTISVPFGYQLLEFYVASSSSFPVSHDLRLYKCEVELEKRDLPEVVV